jgi:hypothetical protein
MQYVRLICDADALIKMAKAGFLETLAQQVELIIGPRVYREAVVEGKSRGYPDAFELDRVIGLHVDVRERSPRPPAQARRLGKQFSLGAGELEALNIFNQEAADGVVSDDRAFLNALASLGVPYLTPAAALLLLAERGSLTGHQALEALERLRPLIPEAQYSAALEDIKAVGRTR